MNCPNDSEFSTFDPCFFERLRYYFGKMMTVRDFQAEQNYFNEKRWLLNRYTIGWGIVCGLKVRIDPNNPENVIIESGLALDRYGNEIVVCQEARFELSFEPPATPPPTPSPTIAPGPNLYYLAIRYKECLTEPAPVPEMEPICNGDENSCIYGRIREMYELKLFEEKPNSDSESNTPCATMLVEQCHDFVHSCPPRSKCQWLILATITIDETGFIHIDNRRERKWLWSNESLANCLLDTVEKTGSERIDRRQFVPLLAQTIKGVKYRNGRILTISDYWDGLSNSEPGRIKKDAGQHPYDITTDGAHIWYTDTASSTESVLRLNRHECSIEKLNVGKKSWGIAFDGCYMWVTHPEAQAVSKINAQSRQADHLIDGMPENPKEIIIAGDCAWIAHEDQSNTITRIHTKTHATDHFVIQGFGTIVAMTFDGSYIWVVYRYNNQAQVKRLNMDGAEVAVSRDITFGESPQDMLFDGTHVWISHKNGATKIDIDSHTEKNAANVNYHLSGIAFDGAYLWAAEHGGERIHRINIYETKQESDYEPGDNISDNRHFGKMCFDGTYMWLTDYEVNDNGEDWGVIHRLLL